MADNPKQTTKEDITLEQAREVLLKNQVGYQQSIVESLKEILGVKTKLTESENHQLKLSREIVKQLTNQNTGYTSLAEKKKEILKNENLISRSRVSSSLLASKEITVAKNLATEVQERATEFEKLVDQQHEFNNVSEQVLQTAKEALDLAEVTLEIQLEELTNAQKAALYEQQSVDILKEANAERQKEANFLEEVEESLGVSGKLLGGFSKIPGFEGIESSLDKVRQKLIDAKEAGDGFVMPSKWKTFGMVLNQTGKDVLKNLTDPLVISAFVTKQLIEVFKTFDKLTSGTARNFGISNDKANELNKELTAVATTQEGFFGTTSNLNAAFQEINNRYGTFAKLNGENLKTFNSLTKEAGLSGEAIGELQDTTYLTGNTLKQQTIEYKGQVKILKATTGLALNEKQILEGIKDISAATKLTLGGSAEAMATAVFKAKALGVEMKDLEGISSSLLNFQSSIEDELSAELLTGKQLNLEGARYAALMGDQAMLAEELADNFGTAADFQSMNVIQQQAMATAVGLTRDSLAESLMKREAMAKLSQFEGETEKDKYNTAVQQLGVEGARQKLGNDALADQMESVSLQDKLSASAQKFQEALAPLAEKVLPVIDRIFKYVGENINGIVTTLKIVVGIMTVMKALSIATAVAQIAGFAALSFGAAAAIATVAAIGATALLSNIGDGIFPADGKARVSSKEGGLFEVSPNDDIIVAPGIAKIVASNSNNASSNSNKASNTSQQIENKVNITPSNTNITLTLDGQAIGNANARQSYGVGSNVKAFGGTVDMSATSAQNS